MTIDERPRFAAMLALLAETFAEPFSELRVEGYWLALGDLAVDAVEVAIRRAMTEARFFPRPAELRELAGRGVPDAGLVEGLLVAHLRAPGGERRAPSDPFLALVVERLGGLRRVVEMPSGERGRALRGLLPGVTHAAQLRGLAMPSEATAAGLPAIARQAMTLVEAALR